MGHQGYTYSSGPPRTCACGRRFRPSAVVVRKGGTGRTPLECPSCAASRKRARSHEKKQD